MIRYCIITKVIRLRYKILNPYKLIGITHSNSIKGINKYPPTINAGGYFIKAID